MPGPEASFRTAVLGAAGFAGGEALRLLSIHPRVASVRALSRSHRGSPVAAVHPSLAHLESLAFEDGSILEREPVDVLFVALPHGESQRAMERLVDASERTLVDLGADFRVGDLALHESFYGPHAAPSLRDSFVYGLADILGDALLGKRRIASPGCFATAALLALWPLASRGLLERTPVCFAVSGSSGAGALPKRTTHHPVRAHNLFGYSLAGHRHEAEILDRLRAWTGDPGAACRLLTHAGPFVRGIHATLHATLREPVPDPLALYRDVYAGRPFVRVRDEPPELPAVVGTNFAHVHAVPRDRGHEAVVTVAIDNLVKGAAGQGIQAMNLALGFGETEGLAFPGIYPC
jgi:N-acetyl-gamma-glutamyl-phosphate reductase common form